MVERKAMSDEKKGAVLTESTCPTCGKDPWTHDELTTRATTAETALAEKEAELADTQSKLEAVKRSHELVGTALAVRERELAAYRDFWREHGEVITHCPGHHSQLVRDADRLLGHSPKPTEVSVELDRVKAELAGVKATRDQWRARYYEAEADVDGLLAARRKLAAESAPPAVETPGATGDDCCWCSDYQSSGLPCLPGKCPNNPANRCAAAPPVPEVVGAKCPECRGIGILLSAESDGLSEQCSTCGGIGGFMAESKDWDGNVLQRSTSTCSACHGTGQSQPSPADSFKRVYQGGPPEAHPSDCECGDAMCRGTTKRTMVTPPSAPVGRSEGEEGAIAMYRVFYSAPSPDPYQDWERGGAKDSWIAAYRFAFAAGSASSVDRERVRECVTLVEGLVGNVDDLLVHKQLLAKLKGLCDGE